MLLIDTIRWCGPLWGDRDTPCAFAAGPSSVLSGCMVRREMMDPRRLRPPETLSRLAFLACFVGFVLNLFRQLHRVLNVIQCRILRHQAE